MTMLTLVILIEAILGNNEDLGLPPILDAGQDPTILISD